MLEIPGSGGCHEAKWYVLLVRSKQEKKVAESLAAREVEHYLPCYSVLSKWKDRRVRLELPLFPGYVFVHLPLLERTRLITVPNVVSLVGSSRGPSEVAEEEVLCIRRGLEHGSAQPHPYLHEGDRVMISSGIMAGMEGILLRRQNGAKIVISIASIFRAFAVELDEDCVRPLSLRAPLRVGGFDPAFLPATT